MNALAAAFSLPCLGIRSRNEDAILLILHKTGFTCYRFYLTLSSSILFICLWIGLVCVLTMTGNTCMSAVAGYII